MTFITDSLSGKGVDAVKKVQEAIDTLQNGMYSEAIKQIPGGYRYDLDEPEFQDIHPNSIQALEDSRYILPRGIEKFTVALGMIRMEDEIFPVEALKVTSPEISNGTFFIKINGHKYGYKALKGDVDSLKNTFDKMSKHSFGKALAWLKRNSELVYGSKKKTEEVDKELPTKVIIECSGDAGKTMEAMLNDIKDTAASGHSFSITVDPDDESPRSYGIDGDGADRIESVKCE